MSNITVVTVPKMGRFVWHQEDRELSFYRVGSRKPEGRRFPVRGTSIFDAIRAAGEGLTQMQRPRTYEDWWHATPQTSDSREMEQP